MGGWKQRYRSQDGREVLIKAMCNNVHSYAMNCFKFPKRTCMQLDNLIFDFFWGKHGDDGKIHWLAWHKLTNSKRQGGMGFRDFACFNDALLAKQAWRLLCNPNELWARQLKGIYFPNGELMEARKGSRASWGWSMFLVGRDFLAKNLLWRVGDGSRIRIWDDKWILGIPNGSLGNAQPGLGCNLQRVDEIIDRGKWRLGDLKNWISENDFNVIVSIPLS